MAKQVKNTRNGLTVEELKLLADEMLLPDGTQHTTLNSDFEKDAIEGFAELKKAGLNSELATYELKHKLNQKIGRPKRREMPRWPSLSVAATIALVVGIGAFYIIKKLGVEQKELAAKNQIILPLITKDDTILIYVPNEGGISEETVAQLMHPQHTKPTKTTPIPSSAATDAIISSSPQIAVAKENRYNYGAIKMDSANRLVAKKEENINTRRIMSGEQKSKVAASMSVIAERIVKGKVLAESDKEPIPGALVTVPGTDISVQTDVNGEFAIAMPTNKDKLVLSFLGFESQTLKLKNTDTFAEIILKPAAQSLAEVVVAKAMNSQAKPAMDDGQYRIYINKHIDYPKAYSEMGKEGTVELEFTVAKNGSLSKFKVIRSMGKDFDEPSIRVMQNGPKWVPAYKNGKPVVTKARYHVNFIQL